MIFAIFPADSVLCFQESSFQADPDIPGRSPPSDQSAHSDGVHSHAGPQSSGWSCDSQQSCSTGTLASPLHRLLSAFSKKNTIKTISSHLFLSQPPKKVSSVPSSSETEAVRLHFDCLRASQWKTEPHY